MAGGALPLPLAGRRAMVVGAESPAGGAIARAYAAAGADVALCVLTADEAVLRARVVRRDAEALGRRAIEYVMDVTLGKNVQVTTRQVVKELGGLDVVAAAPDLPFMQPIEQTTNSDLARVLAVNFSAQFFVVRAAAEEFRRQHHPGRIVLVTSTLAVGGAPAATAYAAAHGAVHQLVRAAAQELAPAQITVNGIALDAADAIEDRAGPRATALGRLALLLSAAGVAGSAGYDVTGEIFPLGGDTQHGSPPPAAG